MWTGGKIAKRMPDVDIDVARRVPDVEVSDGARQLIGKTGDTLRSTPLLRQQRILELTDGTTDGDVMDWMTRNVADPDSNRYQRGLVYLRRTGAQGKELLSKLDEGARKALLRMRDKAVLQRQLTEAYASGDIDATDIGKATRRYDGMDADRRAEFEELMSSVGPAGAELFESADDATLSALLDNPDLSDDAISATARHYADFDVDARQNFADSLDEFDDVTDIRRSSVGLEIDGERYGKDVTVTYSDEGTSFYTDRSPDVDSKSDLEGTSAQNIGEEVVEGDVANDIIEQLEGYEIVYGQHKAGNAQGIDLIARDTSGPQDEFVVIEVKFTSQSKRLNMGAFGERTFGDESFVQMEDGWVEGSYDEDVAGDPDVSVPDDLDAAMQSQNYQKELFVVQDGQTGAIASESVATLMDGISMYKTNGVTK